MVVIKSISKKNEGKADPGIGIGVGIVKNMQVWCRCKSKGNSHSKDNSQVISQVI